MIQHSLSGNTMADILGDARSIAVIGASANPARPSYGVMAYLLANGFRVVPVNPGLAGTEILGQRVVASLAEAPAPIDLVDIFRNSDAALGITREAIALKDKLGIKVIWMQLGVVNHEAALEAEAAGLAVVMNRCTKTEHRRHAGESGKARAPVDNQSSKDR